MAAPAVNDKLPPLVKVVAGSTMFAATLLKFKVKFRKAVSETKFVGEEAAACVLKRVKS